MTRRNLPGTVEDRVWRGHEAKGEVQLQSVGGNISRDGSRRDCRLQFRGPPRHPLIYSEIEGLDPERIADENDFAMPSVRQGEGEDAVQATEEPLGPFFPTVQQHLAVGPGPER